MNLLPKTHSEFASKSYWDTFFTKKTDSFEWYGTYHDLCGLLHKYSKATSKVLVAGCGNSTLSEDLYDVGYRDIHSVDISDVVIKQMTERNKSQRPELVFSKMDILAMEYEDGQFDVVVDKGTCDALCTDSKRETKERMKKMFEEIRRVMKVGGRYMCVSLAQDHVLDTILENFEEGWVVRVHVVAMEKKAGADMGGDLPVFVFVMTKMLLIPGRPAVKVFEVADGDEQLTRLNGIEGIRDTIKSLQQFAMIRHYFKRLHPEEVCSVDLWHPDVPEEPRYTVSIIDSTHKKSTNGPFAIFLVPHGQESNWLFTADDGLRQLAESAGYERLVVVTLHRLHTYGSLDEVKEEVSSTAMEFLQSRADGTKKQWPVLSLGDDLGRRTVQYQGYSEFSGQFVVEDVFDKKSGTHSRRLIFLNVPRLVQSEVKLVKVSKKGKSLVTDVKSLMSSYHMIMISTLGFLATEQRNLDNRIRVLIIGLGGGSLPKYIDKHFRNIHIDVVELDESMVEVASKWFGFESHDHLVTHVGDGIKFVHKASLKGEKWDVVCVDVDSKDPRTGVSGPPPEFISERFLSDMKRILLPSGYCLINVVARNNDKKREMVESVRQVFSPILDCQLKEDLNEVLLLPVKPQNYISHEYDGITKETATLKTEALLKYLANDAKFFDNLKAIFIRHLTTFTKV